MRESRLLFLSLLMVRLLDSQDPPKAPVSPLIGQPAFDFSLNDRSGKRLTLSSHKGETVLLDFWTTWCPPCREELPIIDGIAKSFSDKTVVVLGINGGEDPEVVQRFLQTQALSYRNLLTYDDGSVLERYEVHSFPFVVLIDRNGIVAEAGNYAAKDLRAAMNDKLNNLLRADYVSPAAPDNEKPLPGIIRPTPIPEIASAPRTAEDFFLLATLDLRMNRREEALKNVNTCLSQREDWVPALRLRARVYSAQAKWDYAIADYNRILSKSPNESDIYGLRAALLFNMNKPGKARADLEQQTRLDPGNAQAWMGLTNLYLSDNQPGPAGKAVEQAIKLAPDNIMVYKLRARVEKEKSDWKAELADLDRMLILEPNNNWAKTYRPDVIWRIAQSSTPAAKDDTYSVYSTLLMHPVWDHADDSSVLLIAENTGGTYGGMEPRQCMIHRRSTANNWMRRWLTTRRGNRPK